MASFSRLELIKKFKQEILDWEAHGNILDSKPMDSTHIQMASLDEMMSAYGYAPRRLPNYPEVTDGRFGYYLVNTRRKDRDRRGTFMSFEEAVRMHNGNTGFYTRNQCRSLSVAIVFAFNNRIVHQVSLQRTRKGVVKAQTKWVKFVEDETTAEYFGIPFDDGLVNKDDE